MENLNLIGTQPFETARLKLRKFRISDAEHIFKNWASSDNVTKYVTWNTHRSVDESMEYCAAIIKETSNLDSFHWIIEHSELGEAIGDVSVVKVDKEKSEAHLGYVLGEKWWNKGYMSEAVEAVIAYLIFVIGFDKVTAAHIKENVASGRVMQKCGMTKTGETTRTLENKGGRVVELDVYSMTKGEWLARNLRLKTPLQ